MDVNEHTTVGIDNERVSAENMVVHGAWYVVRGTWWWRVVRGAWCHLPVVV